MSFAVFNKKFIGSSQSTECRGAEIDEKESKLDAVINLKKWVSEFEGVSGVLTRRI